MGMGSSNKTTTSEMVFNIWEELFILACVNKATEFTECGAREVLAKHKPLHRHQQEVCETVTS